MEGAPRIATAADPVFALMEKVEALEARMEEMEERHAKERAEDRKRIADLEAANNLRAIDIASDRKRITRLEAPALSKSTAEDHLDRLFSEMRRLSIRQTTIKDAARFIGISKPHMQKLKPYLAADMRFALLKDPHRPNRYLVRIV